MQSGRQAGRQAGSARRAGGVRHELSECAVRKAGQCWGEWESEGLPPRPKGRKSSNPRGPTCILFLCWTARVLFTEKISRQGREMPDLGPFPPLSTGPTPVLLSFTASVPSHRFPTNSPYASGYHSAACKHSVLDPGPHTLPPHKSREPGTQAHPQMTAARPGP